MCTYFDDLGCGTHYNYYVGIGWVSVPEYEVLKTWHDALSSYHIENNDHQDIQGILVDSKWVDTVSVGETMKRQLAKLLSSEEKYFLIRSIDYLRMNQH